MKEYEYEIGESVYCCTPFQKFKEHSSYRIGGQGDLSLIGNYNSGSYGYLLKSEMGEEFYITHSDLEKYFIPLEYAELSNIRECKIDAILNEGKTLPTK